MDLTPYVGPAIRSFRLAAELSQEELAERAELDRTYISGVECGRRNPTVQSLQAIVAALNTSLDVLFIRARDLANMASSQFKARRKGRAAKR